MSVEAISAALNKSKAKGTTKLVLIGIANHEGDGGSWPTIETLCRYANCSRTRVKRAISELKSLGEIEVLPQQGGNQHTRPDRRPNLYRVLLTNGGHKGEPRDDQRGSLSDERGSLSDPTGVTRVTPNHPIEPSILNIEINPNQSFELFWKAYPRHTAIGAARTAFDKAMKRGESAIRLTEAARRYANDPTRDDKYTPHASTWLNQCRYDDEPQTNSRRKLDYSRNREIQRTKEIISQPKTSISEEMQDQIRQLKRRFGDIAKNPDKEKA